jgi:hypothetical protein
VVDRSKKRRARRGEPVHGDAVLVVRDLLDPDMLRIDAVDNFDVYGYFGISVFAEVGGVDLRWIASHKLSQASWLVVFHADEVVAAGLELWDTAKVPTTMSYTTSLTSSSND